MPHYGLTRTLPDGKPTAGPTVYFLLVACVAVFFLWLNLRKGSAPAPKTVSVTKSEDVKIDAVTSAAASFGEVKQAQDNRAETSSTRRIAETETKPGRTTATDFMDTLTYVSGNLAEPGNNVTQKDEPTLRSTGRTNQTTTRRPKAQADLEVVKLDLAKLVVYSDNSTESEEEAGPGRILPEDSHDTRDGVSPSGFATKDFLPIGTMIPVYLLGTVETTNLEDIVMFGVAENVVFNHDVRLPFGTRLIAQASQAGERNRIAFNVHTILYPDGTELPMSGIAKDLDKRAGVRGYYFPTPVSVQLQQQGLALLEDTQISSPSIPIIGGGATSNQNQNNGRTKSTDTLKNTILRDKYNDLRERYKPYIQIPMGTPAFVQLRSALDLKRRAVNGGATNPMPVLKPFQQNPITPAGEVADQAFPIPDVGRADQAEAPRPRVSSNVVIPQERVPAIKSVADINFREEVKEKSGEFQFLD